MKLRHVLAAVGLTAALVPLTARPVLAAPPANDTLGSATSAGPGFAETIDTSEATTDADDVALNQLCGAPATDASVWYAFTHPAGGGVAVDVSQSSYTAGLIVAVQTPGGFAVVACGPGAVGFLAAAGQTYLVLAFDDQFDGGGNGGTLRISFGEIPPPPTVEITADPVGGFNSRTGAAILTGTLTCTSADFVTVFGEVRQDVGRFRITGFFDVFADGSACDGTPIPWIAEAVGQNGAFKGGKAVTVAFSFACGPFQCADGFATQAVQLKGGRRA